MNTSKKKKGRFKVGDWVAFPFGAHNVTAQIIEERGPLGLRGRHLYRICIAQDSDEPDSFEMPEDHLAPAALPDKTAIIQYLKEGGLVTMLRSNLGGGRANPKAWLTYTRDGDVSHTFSPERGVIGGAAVPFFALHESKVFTGKQEEVIGFLESLGLNRGQAQDVIAAIGTAP